MTEPLFTGTLDSSNRDVTITACNNAGFACSSRAAQDLQPISCLQHSCFAWVFICKKLAPPQNGGLMFNSERLVAAVRGTRANGDVRYGGFPDDLVAHATVVYAPPLRMALMGPPLDVFAVSSRWYSAESFPLSSPMQNEKIPNVDNRGRCQMSQRTSCSGAIVFLNFKAVIADTPSALRHQAAT